MTVQVGAEACIPVGIVRQTNVQGQAVIVSFVAEVNPHNRSDSVFRGEPHKIPMCGCVVDVGQGQRCDARVLCFSEQFTGLHQPVPQAEPRVAMQVHGAKNSMEQLPLTPGVLVWIAPGCLGIAHSKHLQVVMDGIGVFGVHALSNGLKQIRTVGTGIANGR